MTKYRSKQIPYFKALDSGYAYANTVQVRDCTLVRITVPAELVEVINGLLKDVIPWINVEDRSQESNFSCIQLRTEDDYLTDLQIELFVRGLPHTVYIEATSDTDQWARADYRYIDGEYLRLEADHYDESIGVYAVKDMLEKQALTALAIEIERRILIAYEPEFTQEDIDGYKVNQLKEIING